LLLCELILSSKYFVVLFEMLQPDDEQQELMHRTAVHILSSPNPVQLEMRILANHGGDKRFAFLRGRWSRSWKALNQKIRVERAGQQLKASGSSLQPVMGLGGVAEYGDSDDDSGEDGDNEEVRRETEGIQEKVVVDDEDELAKDAATKQARRARAKEWAEKRRAHLQGMS
jgi:hypothetical protein